jgi:hypothetical protein
MGRNMFWFDRALRTGLGLWMLTLAFLHDKTLLYTLGSIMVVTGASGFCPLLLVTGSKEADA